MLSCLQSIGVVNDVTQLLQLPDAGVVFGSGYSFTNNSPPLLRRSAGILLPGNACPVSGSSGTGGVQPAIGGPLKSPARSAAVGTKADRTLPRRSIFHSSDAKKNSLSR